MRKRYRQIFALGTLLALVLGTLAAPLPIAAAGEWYAEYFSNVDLAGAPTLTRFEVDINHDWGTGSPGGGVPADNFSARYTRDIWFSTGTHRFSYRSDDGIRVWINDVLIVDDWNDHAAIWRSVDHFVPGGVNRVRIEHYERSGTAALQIGWELVTGNGAWTASFWDNPYLSGSAVHGRLDAAVDFDWGNGSPDPKVPVDNFSARWSRALGFEAGTYRFFASADDGVRIYVDGRLVVDAWFKQSLPNTRSGDLALSAGNHTVVVDYFEQGGEAAIHVWWDRVDTLGGWEGRYYDNRELRGAPALIRDDREINFDWGEGSPVSWMTSDNFSVRWTRTINLRPGLYRFNSRSDDGIRLWIDDIDLRLNHWEPQEYTWHYQDWHWLEGPHTLRVEYFEGTGSARVQFWWDYAATVEAAQAMAPSPVYRFTTAPQPPSTPQPTPKTPPGVQLPGPWQGEYFTGRDLQQQPVLVRTDQVIDFDWGWASPDDSIPVNQFAVRWTGTFDFEGGRYRFTTFTDDGVRVYVDGRLVINSWRPMRGTRYATVNLTSGQHTIVVEYFEATQAARARLTWQRLGR